MTLWSSLINRNLSNVGILPQKAHRGVSEMKVMSIKSSIISLLDLVTTVLTRKYAPQNVHDSVSNVSHLPTINNRIQR